MRVFGALAVVLTLLGYLGYLAWPETPEPPELLFGASQTFGKTTNGIDATFASTDIKLTSSSTPSVSGTVQSLTCRLWVTGGGSANWRGVIYSDSGTSPTNLLAVTDDSSFSNSSEAEVTANFTGANQITVTAGVLYWIGPHIQDPGASSWNISRAGISNMRVTNGNDVWTGGADNPHSADKTVLSGPIDCYVTFDDAPAGGTEDDTVFEITLEQVQGVLSRTTTRIASKR